MKVALVGAELEENLGLRYMASSLEQRGHLAEIIPYNAQSDIEASVSSVIRCDPNITGLSMVFTSRAREFCNLADLLREKGYGGHIIAGGHFAALNCKRLLEDFPSFDSVALCEGEELIGNLAENLDDLSEVSGLCYRDAKGSIRINQSEGNPDKLDELPFPRRTTFHDYYGKPIASVLSSRGCWRNCAFCSINAWYESGGGKKFRLRSEANIVEEMKELYFDYGVRIFNFQDDNFFLANPEMSLTRFVNIRDKLVEENIENIAIAIKARPDSITKETAEVLDDLGLFRVFLGVENASENGLRNLNRRQTFEDILRALRILNDVDVHIAFNILLFEPDTTMEDIKTNLDFIERHVENPLNFCRAEAYAGTGLEEKLRKEDMLLGDYFGFDYRIKDPRCEAFHQIANYAFFERNFNDNGLHYFNMEVDFKFQLLRRFYPDLVSQTLRSRVRNFIKLTNIDTFEKLSSIYDFVESIDPDDQVSIRGYATRLRGVIDSRSRDLISQGKVILDWMDGAYESYEGITKPSPSGSHVLNIPFLTQDRIAYKGVESLNERRLPVFDFIGRGQAAIPYTQYKRKIKKSI